MHIHDEMANEFSQFLSILFLIVYSSSHTLTATSIRAIGFPCSNRQFFPQLPSRGAGLFPSFSSHSCGAATRTIGINTRRSAPPPSLFLRGTHAEAVAHHFGHLGSAPYFALGVCSELGLWQHLFPAFAQLDCLLTEGTMWLMKKAVAWR